MNKINNRLRILNLRLNQYQQDPLYYDQNSIDKPNY